MTLTAINPANGDTIKTYKQTPLAEAIKRVETAHHAFTVWKEMTFSQRGEFMKEASIILNKNKEEYAKIMSMEMGKPIRQGRAEVEKCAWVCEYYADNTLNMLQPEKIETDARNSFVSFQPLGVVLAIISVKDEQEAVQVANDSSFGLGAAIFTEDISCGERIATYELEAGCCFVNDFVKSDPRLPFGGIKSSGYGRELSHYGIKEFVNIKTVYVK
jgi:acyl-CoA reductase-like NAD-dependent aldehyde dehydrogenase